MNWYIVAIGYLWLVGIPGAYKAIYRGGAHSKFHLALAHFWPITFPALFLVGLSLRREVPEDRP